MQVLVRASLCHERLVRSYAVRSPLYKISPGIPSSGSSSNTSLTYPLASPVVVARRRTPLLSRKDHRIPNVLSSARSRLSRVEGLEFHLKSVVFPSTTSTPGVSRYSALRTRLSVPLPEYIAIFFLNKTSVRVERKGAERTTSVCVGSTRS